MSLSPKPLQTTSTTTPFSVTDILSPLENTYGESEVNSSGALDQHNIIVEDRQYQQISHINNAINSEDQGHLGQETHHTHLVTSSGMDPGSIISVSAGLHIPNIGESAAVLGSLSPQGSNSSQVYRHSMPLSSSQHSMHHQQMPYQSMNTAAAMAAGMNGSYNLHSMHPPTQTSFHPMGGPGTTTGYCNGGMSDLSPYNNVQPAAATGWYSAPANPDPRFGSMSSKLIISWLRVTR